MVVSPQAESSPAPEGGMSLGWEGGGRPAEKMEHLRKASYFFFNCLLFSEVVDFTILYKFQVYSKTIQLYTHTHIY